MYVSSDYVHENSFHANFRLPFAPEFLGKGLQSQIYSEKLYFEPFIVLKNLKNCVSLKKAVSRLSK